MSLDTNVLVYSTDTSDAVRHPAAKSLIRRAARADAVLMLQSLAEFAHVTVRKLKMPVADVKAVIDQLRELFPVHAADPNGLDMALEMVRREKLAFWDAMLWAAARQAGCEIMLSEDLQDGRKLGGVTVINPFRPENQAIVDQVLAA